MSTEMVVVWCRPKNGGRHRIAAVEPHIVDGVVHYMLRYKAQVIHPSGGGDFQTYGAQASDPLNLSSSTTFEAYCPSCKSPLQLSSQQLYSLLAEAQREQRTTEMVVRPDAALDADKAWRLAAQLNGLPQGSIYPDAKNRRRKDPRGPDLTS